MVTYTFDAANRKTSMTASGSAAVSYGYDDANRLTTVKQGSSVVSMSYDDANRIAGMTLPNGVVATYAFDANNMLTSLAYAKGGALLDTMTYSYDATARNTNFVSTLGQLNKAIAARGPATFNLADQLVSLGDLTSTYDNSGNLTSDGVNRYTWNARNQLIGIAGGVSAAFAYDPIGRRTSRTVGATTTTFLHDGANLIQERSGANAAQYLTGPGLDQVFARTGSAATMTYLRDGLGSVFGLMDANGSLVTQYQYDPYGNTGTSGASSSNPRQYSGRENDGTGLYLHRARYYSPAMGRFISEDPIGLGGGVNEYSYAWGNPISFADPLGLFVVAVTGVGSGVLVLYNDNGTIAGSYPYSSGNGSTDFTQHDVGPIPPGTYTVDPSEISPAGFFRKHIDPRDWGDYRVPLNPDPTTNTFGRGGFYIHGGKTPGTSGCIEVDGPNQNDLFKKLENASGPVPVIVNGH